MSISESTFDTGPYQVNICNQTSQKAVNQNLLRQGICLVLQDYKIERAVIGLGIITDDAIQKMNKQFLDHDYATDVLSFPLSENVRHVLEGEIAISYDTAQQRAGEFGWNMENELLLYAVHGTLHLVGLSDQTPEDQYRMRLAEKDILSQMKITLPDENTDKVNHCHTDASDESDL
ncbi:MAG: rRNA maturation RNase YbeY [Planctomycetaceae bacterium]|nr:rRNA maturation RNase YbeY [Planctomycetaceae bacterium]